MDELLRASQDEVLLKLSVDSHLSRNSSSPLDKDLARRFQALKLPSAGVTKQDDDDELGANLSARLSALKASKAPDFSYAELKLGKSGVGSGELKGDVEDEDEDEVEKVMQWAMDAARLDPSKSDDDDDDEEEECKKNK
ncbi:hypothetical protein GIB67_038735 [Kingdonia uniflora]|uniref:Uncharacterized protein n=1 Tax=Kingdonia uniflora TaxID=39325 RepID=A0A7J7NT93_9MAGN|nr:hypothetical protein GIB67_038735 [Kingdonia uniflora]